MEKAFLIDVVSKIYVATDSTPVDMQTYELCSDMIDVVVDVSCIYGYTNEAMSCQHCFRLRDEAEGLAYDEETQSVIRLNNGMVLYLREVNRYLALVCLLREDNYDKHGTIAMSSEILISCTGLIDYNFQCFRRAIVDVFKHMVRG